MLAGRPRATIVVLLVWLLAVAPGLSQATDARAQVQQGATLTILRGQVALLRADGSTVQPAPNGSTIDVGDELRTISRSGALITFFSGTEIEMGEDTILVVEQLSRQGDRIDISLRQALGATVNRVQSLAGTGSTYQIQAGGAVALVRGTTFAMVGPVTTSSGNVVTIACREDCSAISTFAGCAMAPFSGLGVTTSGGKVESSCFSFPVDRAEGLYEAATQGVTTVQQAVQGDTRGVPAGQVAAGSRQETDARVSQQQAEAHVRDPEKDPELNPSLRSAPLAPNGSPVPTPPPGAQPCNVRTESGGTAGKTTVHELGRTNGTFQFQYEAFGIPDKFEIIYQGNTLLNTNFVSGGATVPIAFSGTSSLVTVIVTGNSNTSTAWNYTLSCPS